MAQPENNTVYACNNDCKKNYRQNFQSIDNFWSMTRILHVYLIYNGFIEYLYFYMCSNRSCNLSIKLLVHVLLLQF